MTTAASRQPMTEQRAKKDILRMTLMGRRRSISPADRCIWDSDAARQLLRLPEYQAADKLLIYLSTPWEVATAIPIAHAIGMGKTVAVPRWGGGNMEFCPFTDYEGLTHGRKGILQPSADAEPLTDFTNAICIVPALAADSRGLRIGYGGGYYDRFLCRFNGYSAILAYDSMVMDELPAEPHDRAVDSIITPSRVIIPIGGNGVGKGDKL